MARVRALGRRTVEAGHYDGQNGRMGCAFDRAGQGRRTPLETLVVGTNAIATAAMMKAGADRGATGENPVLVACRDADIIAGPIGILMADALMGEITPAIAVAIGQSRARRCAASEQPLRQDRGGRPGADALRIMDEAVEVLRELCAPRSTTL